MKLRLEYSMGGGATPTTGRTRERERRLALSRRWTDLISPRRGVILFLRSRFFISFRVGGFTVSAVVGHRRGVCDGSRGIVRWF